MEQILCVTSCIVSLTKEQQSQNLLLKVDPLSTIRNNKLITQGKQIEIIFKTRRSSQEFAGFSVTVPINV